MRKPDFKGLIEDTLVSSGLAGLIRSRYHFAVLAYHNVVPDTFDAGPYDRSLHLPAEAFSRHLDWLQEHCQVVPLGDLLRESASSDPLRVAITFDDAYRGVVCNALPMLAARAMPATLFVCPGVISEPGFWWDRVSAASVPPGLREDVRERALNELEGRQELILSEWPASTVHAHLAPASFDELAAAAGTPGTTLAPHGWKHRNMATVSRGELADELALPREWLREHFQESALTTHLAYPYGRWTTEVLRTARAVGYEFTYRVEGGPFRMQDLRQDRPIPRVSMPAGQSQAGFQLRVSGVVS